MSSFPAIPKRLSLPPFPLIVSSVIVPYKELSKSFPFTTAASAEVTINGDNNIVANKKKNTPKFRVAFFSSNLFK
jgi:hypothetical protein